MDKSAAFASATAPKVHAARATSHYLRQDSAEDLPAKQTNTSDYYEDMALGIVDGLVSTFNENCRSGLSGTIIAGFQVLDNVEFYNPTKFAKFQLATAQLTEATTVVTAYCKLDHLTDQFVTLFDYTNPDQYVVVASRIAGTLINEYNEKKNCWQNGKERGNGYDVGYCQAKFATVILDGSI